MPISKKEYDNIMSYNEDNRSGFSIDNLINKTERTLLYGYTLDRNSFHVYVKNNKVHLYVYGLNGTTIEHRSGFIPLPELVPCKRSYPERTDPEFLKILVMAGISNTPTTFDEEFYEKNKDRLFFGSVID